MEAAAEEVVTQVETTAAGVVAQGIVDAGGLRQGTSYQHLELFVGLFVKALKYTTLIILDALKVCSSIPKASFCFHISRNFN